MGRGRDHGSRRHHVAGAGAPPRAGRPAHRGGAPADPRGGVRRLRPGRRRPGPGAHPVRARRGRPRRRHLGALADHRRDARRPVPGAGGRRGRGRGLATGRWRTSSAPGARTTSGRAWSSGDALFGSGDLERCPRRSRPEWWRSPTPTGGVDPTTLCSALEIVGRCDRASDAAAARASFTRAAQVSGRERPAHPPGAGAAQPRHSRADDLAVRPVAGRGAPYRRGDRHAGHGSGSRPDAGRRPSSCVRRPGLPEPLTRNAAAQLVVSPRHGGAVRHSRAAPGPVPGMGRCRPRTSLPALRAPTPLPGLPTVAVTSPPCWRDPGLPRPRPGVRRPTSSTRRCPSSRAHSAGGTAADVGTLGPAADRRRPRRRRGPSVVRGSQAGLRGANEAAVLLAEAVGGGPCRSARATPSPCKRRAERELRDAPWWSRVLSRAGAPGCPDGRVGRPCQRLARRPPRLRDRRGPAAGADLPRPAAFAGVTVPPRRGDNAVPASPGRPRLHQPGDGRAAARRRRSHHPTPPPGCTCPPRTVEHHVARLLVERGATDRAPPWLDVRP